MGNEKCKKDKTGRCQTERTIRSSRLPDIVPQLMPTKKQTSQVDVIKTSEYEARASSIYGMCDVDVAIIGKPCDTLTSTKGPFVWLVRILAIFLIGFVLFFDIFIDILVVIFDQVGNATEGIPIVGSIVGFIEGMELDDVIDVMSMVIMFYFIGPVTLVGIPELAEGVIEIVPFWTLMLIIWFIVIRPVRQRDIARREKKFKEMKEAETAATQKPETT